ncbi:sulfite exporter TauE/SafE family protein 3-like [Humulus lupulus]|uniref:sulfite exporter TauE/SafE family protein 3-like n=1 Tax=Humulus lupulus TaxID=3486 RepID=UPI002B40F297|nr:sulfite exporter TauE/SafE family protein 3-like [Humulus lupulus]
MIKEAARRLQSNGNDNDQVEYNNTNNPSETKESKRTEVPLLKNTDWKELGLLTAVWIVILGLQIAKNYTKNCSVLYWALNFLQIPVTVGVTLYEAVSLYKGKRVIASKGEVVTIWRVKKLIICCVVGILAGMLGGLLGLGGGFIMGPLFLELGIPPQVSSATATLVMAYSSSMSVVEYYLLRRFPVPYALYFAAVATISALVGQHVVGKVISIIGRASLIIFILSSMIFISAITLGGIGISNTIEKIHHKEYMGFEDICQF